MQSASPLHPNKTAMNVTKELVRQLLEQYPQTRDNDNLLMSLIWRKESNLFNFFSRLESGKLTPAETIRRCRQRLQLDHPELRGTMYELRQKHQSKVKKELGYKV
jgi:hypothetical protein